MKNDFFKTTFFQNEAILCETNFEAKRCNSFYFSTISFNNFQIKLIILVALFIILIFTTNNTYAFDETLQIDEKLVNDTFGTSYTTLNDDLHNFIMQEKNNNSALYQNLANLNGIFIKPTSSSGNYLQLYFFLSDNFVCSSYSNNNINIATDGANYFYVSFVYSNFVFSEYGDVSQSTSNINTSQSILTNLLLYTDNSKTSLINSTKYIYSDKLIISNNLEEPEDPEEPIQSDLSEVINAIDTNSNIQVLILFFLISLFVYLIFYTVANSGRRNK